MLGNAVALRGKCYIHPAEEVALMKFLDAAAKS